jgi:hypothetical protein
MKTFAIYEGNMERLEKKITRIRNKCRQYCCDFHYAEVGEEFRQIKDEQGQEYTARFVLVEAEGKAIVNGWKFIAVVEHSEKGNIINKTCDIEVPERYYTCDPVCEHCNSKRYRKDTFLVMNEGTGEFKQVGKSCLKDFTSGMSAEGVAQYTALFEELIAGETPCGGRGETYHPVKEFLMYVAETIKHFGYVRTQYGGRSTRDRAFDYYMIEHGGRFFPKEKECLKEEMQSVSFNANTDENAIHVSEALAWLDAQNEDNNYMHNLKTACSLEYTTYRNLGLLTSLFPTYNRELKYQAEKTEQERQNALKKASEQNSMYIGSVGDRIEIDVQSIECVTSWETQYGTTKIYKIVDTNGNVYTWKTSNYIGEVSKIKGTVKNHNEYRGVKQTEITRCKVA